MHNHFEKLRTNLELDPTLEGRVTTKHTAIRDYLKNNHPGFQDSHLIGSLQRKTRIRPDSGIGFDIDILVVLGSFAQWVASGGIAATDAMAALTTTVRRSQRYRGMDPVADAPTVTLTHADNLQVELVAAYTDKIGVDAAGNSLGPVGRGYWVARDGVWVMADYDYEAEHISNRNAAASGYLVPTIKMLKAIKRVQFPQMKSFPLEVLAAAVVPETVMMLKLTNSAITYPALLHDFFSRAIIHLGGAIKIPGSKSPPIFLDGALIPKLQTRFDQIARWIAAIPQQPNQAQAWKLLFGDCFPLSA